MSPSPTLFLSFMTHWRFAIAQEAVFYIHNLFISRWTGQISNLQCVNNTFSWTTCLLSAFVYMASAACKFVAYCVLGKMVCFLSNCYEAFRVSMGARNRAKGWGKIPWTWYKKMVENGEDASSSQQRWHWSQCFPIYSVLLWCIKPWRKKI